MVTRLACMGLLLGLIMAPASTRAEPTPTPGTDGASSVAAARAAFDSGSAAAIEERWEDAATAFALSLSLLPRPNTRHNLAVALCHVGRTVECLEHLDAYLASTDPVRDEADRQRARSLRESALGQVGTVSLHVNPPSAKLEIDGQPSTALGADRRLYVQPGTHRLVLTATGYKPMDIEAPVDASALWEHTAVLTRLSLRVADTAPAASVPNTSEVTTGHLGPILVTTAGGLMLGASVITGILAKRADDQVLDGCDGQNPCYMPALQPVQKRAQTLGRVTDALWITGALSAGAGVVWWVLDGMGDRPMRNARITRIAPTAQGLSVRF